MNPLFRAPNYIRDAGVFLGTVEGCDIWFRPDLDYPYAIVTGDIASTYDVGQLNHRINNAVNRDVFTASNAFPIETYQFCLAHHNLNS